MFKTMKTIENIFRALLNENVIEASFKAISWAFIIAMILLFYVQSARMGDVLTLLGLTIIGVILFTQLFVYSLLNIAIPVAEAISEGTDYRKTFGLLPDANENLKIRTHMIKKIVFSPPSYILLSFYLIIFYALNGVVTLMFNRLINGV